MKSFVSPLITIVLFCTAVDLSAGAEDSPWTPVGLSGGGGMFAPGISPVDPNLMLINCDMSGAYLSEDGGHNWQMINQAQLRSDTRCRPGFHPRDRNVIYASSGGYPRVSRDGGKTFARVGHISEALWGEIAVYESEPDTLLVGTWNGRVWISRNAGTNWVQCEGPEGKPLGFFFDRTQDGRTMFAATVKGIWRSEDGGQTWADKTQGLARKEIQGFTGGADTTNKVVMLYCTVSSQLENGKLTGGVYSSRDRGETWQSAMGRGLNLETNRADEYSHGPISQYHQILSTDARPQTVYVMNTSTGFFPPHSDNVYRSDDGGQTWRETWFLDPRHKPCNVAPDYVIASTGQSYKGGEAPFGAAICNRDPERVLLTRNEVHITHNGGKDWFCGSTYPAPGQKPGPDTAWECNGLVVTTTWHYYIDPFEPNRHYICYTDLGWSWSLDSGHTWHWWNQKTWAPWRNTCYEIAFDPEIPGKMWGAFSDVHDIPNDNIISERHGHNRPGGVCLSLDFGASWKPTGANARTGSVLPAKAVTSVVLDPKSQKTARTLYAGVFDAGVYKSTDAGDTWAQKKQGLGSAENMRVSKVALHRDGTLFAMICAKRPGQGKPLMSQGVGLYRSTDGAEHWQKLNTSQTFFYPKDFSVDPQNSRRILMGICDTNWQDKFGGLYRTEDGGQSWQRIGREGPQTFGGYYHPKHPGWVYMTLTEDAPGPGLWLSKDDGRSWEPFNELPFSNIQRVEFDRADPEQIYVTTFGASIWRGPSKPAR